MVEAPVQFEGGSFKMTVSIGAAVFPGDGKDAESLVRIADAAMYSTKRQRQSAG
jgi:GGDEF domain-containing protein